MKRNIAIALMGIGTLLVFLAAGLFLYNANENQQAKENSQAVMQTIREQLEEDQLKKEEGRLPQMESDPFDHQMKVVEIDGYGYIGYLTVPALDLDLPVMADWDYDRLNIAPCRYYGSAKADNLVIAAHNFRYHFGYLGKLQIGDQIIFTDMDALTYRYQVVSVETLSPYAVDQVKDTGDDLVLYTCTYSGSQRIVVRCSYVQE